MAKEKKKMQEKPLSLREKIKAYRRELHGDVAAKFDEVFITSCGYGKSLKDALQEGKDLQKAFVAAKTEAEKLAKQTKQEPPKDEFDWDEWQER